MASNEQSGWNNRTVSGINLKHLYTPEDISKLDYEKDLGEPGVFPFTRGIHPTMYSKRLWTIRNYAGFGSSEDANERYKFLIKQGQNGINVALDLPTQLGFDSDSPESVGEVGRVGVAIDTLDDMEKLFDGIPLDKIGTAFTINATACVILAMYISVAQKQGVPAKNIRGTVQNDILKEYLARGAFIFPPQPSIRIACDIIEYCLNNTPKFNAISISGHMNCAGAYPVQTAAYMFLHALVHIDELIKRGIDVDRIAPLIAFMTTTKDHFFENIAYVRASRRMWAKIMRDQYGAKDRRSMVYRVALAADTANLISKQPLNNIARLTIGAMACVMAGGQAVLTPCYDEAYAIPSEESARISIMIQHILGHETGLPGVADPLGGSYYMEALTNECEKKINEIMDDINKHGGILELIEKGVIQKQLSKQLYQKQKDIQTGAQTVIGLNKYALEDEDISQYEGKTHKYDNSIHKRQVEKLKKIKLQRNNKKVKKLLLEIEKDLKDDTNIMPSVIKAVQEYATVGEIVQTIKKIHGRFKSPSGM